MTLVRAAVALAALVVLLTSGQRYFFCHMADRAMASCCCAKQANDPLTAERADAAELVERPCCEPRGAEALGRGGVIEVDGAPAIAAPRAFTELPVVSATARPAAPRLVATAPRLKTVSARASA